TRVCPSASPRRMLRDASTRIGTMASRDPAGGRMAIGRNRHSTRITSATTRSATSVPRWPRVSGDSGRRYSPYATAAIAAASSTASHHGRGCAKCINQSAIRNPQSAMSRLLLPGYRLEVAVDLFLVAGRRVVVGAGRQAILDLLLLDLLRQRRLDVVERLRRLPPHFLPLGEILLEGFGAWRRDAGAGRRLESEA